jgi:hypothetical protein
MAFATHLIKIRGIFDKQKWTKEELKKYVDRKIKEIESFYHADLELFRVEEDTIEIWVFIHAFSSEATNEVIEKWLKNHIEEDMFLGLNDKLLRKYAKENKTGIVVKDFKVKKLMSIYDIYDGEKPKLLIHLQ